MTTRSDTPHTAPGAPCTVRAVITTAPPSWRTVNLSLAERVGRVALGHTPRSLRRP